MYNLNSIKDKVNRLSKKSASQFPLPYKESVVFEIHVADYNRAKKFYQEILGFKVILDCGPEIGWCELALPVKGSAIGLNLQESGKIAPGSGMLTLEVSNLDEARAYLKSKGVKTRDTVHIPNLVSYFSAYDSEGNMIRFASDPEKTTWTHLVDHSLLFPDVKV